MAIFGNKARAAALCVAILIVLYGTTEVAPIRAGGVTVFSSGGKRVRWGKVTDPREGRYQRGYSAEAAVQLRSERESITGWGEDYDSD